MTTVYQYIDKHDLLERLENGLGRLRLDSYKKSMVYERLHGYKIVINYRAKCRAGAVHSKNKTLSLTHKFFECESRNDDHIDTLLHEVAHIITGAAYHRVKAHGWEWKSVMRALGATPDRCCNYDYLGSKDKQPKHEYKCQDCGHIYHTQRALVRPERRRHGRCKYKLNGGRLIHTQLR